jgi:hypothetical protein
MNETDGMSHVMIVNATDFDGKKINIQESIQSENNSPDLHRCISLLSWSS